MKLLGFVGLSLILSGGLACDRSTRRPTPPTDGARTKTVSPSQPRVTPAPPLSMKDTAFMLRVQLGLSAPPKPGPRMPFDEDPPPTPRPLLTLGADGCAISSADPDFCKKRHRDAWGLRTGGGLVAVALIPRKTVETTIRRVAALASAKVPPRRSHGELARSWSPSPILVRLYLPLTDAKSFTQTFVKTPLCRRGRLGLIDWLVDEEKKSLGSDTLARLKESRRACASADELRQPAFAGLKSLAALKPVGVAVSPYIRACFLDPSGTGARCDHLHSIVGLASYDDLLSHVFVNPQSRKLPRKFAVAKDLAVRVRRITVARSRFAVGVLRRAGKIAPPAAWLKPGGKRPDLEIRVTAAAAALARLDAANGILQLFQTVGGGKPAEVHKRFGIGAAVALRTWRFQAASTDLLRDLHLTVHIRGPHRGLRLRWKLTPLGKRTLAPLVKAVQGQNLLQNNHLIQALTDKLLPALSKAAASKGVLANDTEVKELVGFLSLYGRLLLTARLWPDLLRSPAGTAWLRKLAPALKKAGFRDFRLRRQGDRLEASLVP